MKSLKTFLAAALILGATGAFATKAVHAAQSGQTTYNWKHYTRAGVPDGLTYTGSVSDAQLHFSCSGSGPKCADAPGAPTIIRYN